MTHLVSAAAATAFAAIVVASPAHAVRGWHPPVQIGTGSSPSVAVNADGTAAMTWRGYESVQAATRISGTWSAPHDLGPVGCCAEVAVDGAGNVVVAWLGPDSRVQAALKPVGGAWLPSEAISAPSSASFGSSVDVAFDGDGNATAIWGRAAGSAGWLIETSVRNASSGAWQQPVQIGQGIGPDVDVQLGGSAIAVWAPPVPGGSVQGALRGSDGTWEPATTLSEPSHMAGPRSGYARVGVDGAGNATALWTRLRQDEEFALESASRPFGSAAWQPPETIATERFWFPNLQSISGEVLAVSPAGGIVTAWDQALGNDWVRAAYRVPAQPWQTQDLSQRSFQTMHPAVAADSVGNALALWTRSTSSRFDAIIEVSLRDVVTGIWTAPMSISANGGILPDVAFDGSGNGVAVWARYVQDAPFPVEAAAFAEGGIPPPPGPPPGPGPPPPGPFCEPACPQPPPPPKCRVPRVVGKKQYLAQAAIRRARCSTGRVRKVRSRRPRGRVLGQNPRAGKVVPRNTWVKLTVSRGRR